MLLATAPGLASAFLRCMALTWHFTEEGRTDLSVRQAQPEPRIYAYWHEFVLPSVGIYRDRKIHPFASKSFDGELISRTMDRLGFGETARGSSSRGGAQGLLEMKGMLEKGGHVAITVDGPRGPRRVAQEGALKLAQVSGFAVVPFSLAPRPRLRLKSWDSMVLPLPFMGGVVKFGDEIRVARALKSLEAPHQKLQRELDRITASLEADSSLSR